MATLFKDLVWGYSGGAGNDWAPAAPAVEALELPKLQRIGVWAFCDLIGDTNGCSRAVSVTGSCPLQMKKNLKKSNERITISNTQHRDRHTYCFRHAWTRQMAASGGQIRRDKTASLF